MRDEEVRTDASPQANAWEADDGRMTALERDQRRLHRQIEHIDRNPHCDRGKRVQKYQTEEEMHHGF
jgi:hypothetical protein